MARKTEGQDYIDQVDKDIARVEGGTVVVPFTDVSNLNTFDEVARALADAGNAAVVDSRDLGDGYTVLKDKSRLVGSEFMITKHVRKFSERFEAEFSIIHLITAATDSKVVITDGSTGIHAQLAALPEGAYAYCKNGLVASTYDLHDEEGNKTGEATTYYLDISGGNLPATGKL